MATTTTRTYLGTTAEQRRLLRREQLIKAGCDVYALRGYRNATVKSICEKAGLTERYFYESFPNNEALFLALFKNVTSRMLESLRAIGDTATGEPTQKARAILSAYYSELQRDPAVARVFVIEATEVSSAVNEIFRLTFESFADLLVQAWRGEAASFGPVLKTGVAGAIVHIARDWVSGGFSQPVRDVVEAALTISTVFAGPEK